MTVASTGFSDFSFVLKPWAENGDDDEEGEMGDSEMAGSESEEDMGADSDNENESDGEEEEEEVEMEDTEEAEAEGKSSKTKQSAPGDNQSQESTPAKSEDDGIDTDVLSNTAATGNSKASSSRSTRGPGRL